MRRKAQIFRIVFSIVLVGIGGFLGYVALSETAVTANQNQSLRTVTIGTARGTIYDTKMRPMVNRTKEYRAALLPTNSMISKIRSATDANGYQTMTTCMANNAPAVIRLLRPIAISEELRLAHIPVRYTSSVSAAHLLGYLDSGKAKGVAGIEASFDDILSAYGGEATATFSINGIGELQTNTKVTGNNTLSNCAGGIALSIDLEVQEIIEKAASSLEKGAITVLDPQSGAVIACASTPTFHPDRVADSILKDNGALINRALSRYDCGSVFKIVTAVAALEKGITVNKTYTCSGGMTVDQTVFHCHSRVGHQSLNMEQAFALSCNLYFIQLAQEIGARSLLLTAERLGLSDAIVLADEIQAPAGIFPTLEDLSASAALANLSFGQGKLMLSPLHVAAMTTTIANGGVYYEPYLYKGEVDTDGVLHAQEGRGGVRVLSSSTAESLQRMMRLVVSEGTGTKAEPSSTTAAGKTGTAQTGQKNNNRAVLQSWFTGYFPADAPQYVITVLAEDSETSGINAATIFCEISNNITQKEGEQTN